MIASALVLLIACANIANLLLVRGMQRKVGNCPCAPLSVRPAAELCVSCSPKASCSQSWEGLPGLIVAYLGTHMLLKLAFPGAQNVPIDTRPSPVVLAFTFVLALLTGVLFGVAPACVAAKTDPADALRSGGRGTTIGVSLLQREKIAGADEQDQRQRRLHDLTRFQKPLYRAHQSPSREPPQPQLETLYRTIEQRFHALPGISKVGLSTYTPMEDNNWGNGLQIQGQPDTDSGASVVKISPE